jgi:hypothetical protein
MGFAEDAEIGFLLRLASVEMRAKVFAVAPVY